VVEEERERGVKKNRTKRNKQHSTAQHTHVICDIITLLLHGERRMEVEIERVVELSATAAVSKSGKKRTAERESGPLLLQFDVAPPAELLLASPPRSKARLSCYAHTADTRVEVVAETPKMQYRGSTAGEIAPLPMRQAVGVLDTATGRVTLVEVPPPVALRPELKAAATAKLVGQEAVASSLRVSDSLSYAERKQLLTDAFGSKLSKLKAKQAAASALPQQLADVDSKLTGVIAASAAAAAPPAGDTGAVAENAVETLNEDLPPLYTDATTPTDAYPIEENVSREAWEAAHVAARQLVPLVGDAEKFLTKFKAIGPPPCKCASSPLFHWSQVVVFGGKILTLAISRVALYLFPSPLFYSPFIHIDH